MQFGLTRKEAKSVWLWIRNEFYNALTNGQSVGILNVGVLVPYQKPEHQYRHPETGRMSVAKARKRVRFVAAQALKEALACD